jgi:hypothetical protein
VLDLDVIAAAMPESKVEMLTAENQRLQDGEMCTLTSFSMLPGLRIDPQGH